MKSIQQYKTVHNIDNIDQNSFFYYSHVNFTSGDKLKIFRKGCSSDDMIFKI